MMLKPDIKLRDGTLGVILPDIHVPRHHIPSVNAVLDYLRFLRKKGKPDFILQLGDFADFDSLSRFQVINSQDMVSLVEEIKSANDLLDEIESILPKHCKKYMTLGNHCARAEIYRLNNWDGRDTKMFGNYFGAERIPNAEVLFRLEERGWEWVRYGDVIQIGKCLYTHGWLTGKTHAEKTLLKWFKTIVYGHCHNFSVFNKNGMDGNPVVSYCIGTLSRFDLSYTKGLPQDWIHMFATVEYFKNGNFTFTPTPIVDGKFIRDGRIFG